MPSSVQPWPAGYHPSRGGARETGRSPWLFQTQRASGGAAEAAASTVVPPAGLTRNFLQERAPSGP